jgi:hypothetical protein
MSLAKDFHRNFREFSLGGGADRELSTRLFCDAIATDRMNTMAYLSQLPSTENMLDAAPVASRSVSRLPLGARLSSIAKWIRDYIEMTADCYAAAAIYEHLSRLSDAELHRRGLSRSNLARDVHAAQNLAPRLD